MRSNSLAYLVARPAGRWNLTGDFPVFRAGPRTLMRSRYERASGQPLALRILLASTTEPRGYS